MTELLADSEALGVAKRKTSRSARATESGDLRVSLRGWSIPFSEGELQLLQRLLISA